jgi:hypothetical protein
MGKTLARSDVTLDEPLELHATSALGIEHRWVPIQSIDRDRSMQHRAQRNK